MIQMTRIVTKICLLLGALGVSASVFAAPIIDPALRPLLAAQGGRQDRVVTVIAMFRDKAQLPRAEHSIMGRAAAEVALMQNAKASQMATYQSLVKARESVGAPLSFESLWLFNAAIIRLPASQFKQLASNNDIVELYANHTAHIVNDFAAPARLTGSQYTYGLEKINLPQLRSKAPQIDGKGVRVGVLDTGVDATHPDLKGRVAGFKDFVGNKTAPYDDNSHGTHVSGTISGGNASGTFIGIAPGVQLIMGKVFSASGSASYDALLKAMQWIADPDGNPQTPDQPMLISNSWGGGSPSGSMDPADEPLCKAVAGWVKLGILPVFAAGNSGPGSGSVNIPGACPQSLTAGATDQNDQVASFSSRGPAKWKTGTIIKPTVSAPGVAVISSVPGGGYKAFSGTSMATPHVAGLAALTYQVNPKATVEQVIQLIANSATKLGSGSPNNDYGAGRIDAFNTLKNELILMRGGNPAMMNRPEMAIVSGSDL